MTKYYALFGITDGAVTWDSLDHQKGVVRYCGGVGDLNQANAKAWDGKSDGTYTYYYFEADDLDF